MQELPWAVIVAKYDLLAEERIEILSFVEFHSTSAVKSALKLKARSPKAPALFASKARPIQRSVL